MSTIVTSETIVKFCNCIACGVVIAGPESTKKFRKADHKSFYCINGHRQFWPQKSDTERLREQLEEKERALELSRNRTAIERSAKERAKRSAAAYKGQATKVKRRVANGVCPCCNRTFKDLARHMESKHPGFSEFE